MLEGIKEKIKQTDVVDLEKEALGSFPVAALGILLVTLFLLLVFGGWYLSSKNTLKRVDEKLNNINGQLTSMKELNNDVETYAGAVKNIQSALSGKKKWSALFKELNRVTPKDIVYTTLSVDEKGKVQISGTTSSLGSLAKLMVALQNSTAFGSSVLSNLSNQEGRVSFSLTSTLKTSILTKEVK